jgi:hypothetical protein
VVSHALKFCFLIKRFYVRSRKLVQARLANRSNQGKQHENGWSPAIRESYWRLDSNPVTQDQKDKKDSVTNKGVMPKTSAVAKHENHNISSS